MSGFVAIANASPVSGEPADEIENDGWFPPIKLSEIRAVVRLDGTVTPERLRAATVNAISGVNDRLREFRTERLQAGHGSLAEVPSVNIDGVSRLVMLYRRAVYSSVLADVMERYRGFDATASGDKRADASDPAIDEQLRNVNWAIRDILGQPHVVVDLI